MKDKDYFDFKEDESLIQSFTEDYLRQYYHPDRTVTDDEKATFRFIRKVASRLPPFKTCLEVGCGPTLHHAIMIAPFVQSMDLSDYLDENLKFVKNWLNNSPHAWDWSGYAKYCLEEEGNDTSPQSVNSRLEFTRNLISSLLHINLLSDNPLGPYHKQYDLVATFYCTEEVSLTKERWKKVMATITSLLNPGGYLLMSCLEDTDFYHIQTPDGVSKDLPCARVTESDLRETLSDLGYSMSETIIEVQKTPDQEHEGVNGVLSTLARLKK